MTMNIDEDGKCHCPTCSWKPGPIEPVKFGPLVTLKEAAILVVAVLVLFATVFLGVVVAAPEAFPSDVSSCGLKPPPPLSCLHCRAVCSCDAAGKCVWGFIRKGGL